LTHSMDSMVELLILLVSIGAPMVIILGVSMYRPVALSGFALGNANWKADILSSNCSMHANKQFFKES
jgi:hypothetical protein